MAKNAISDWSTTAADNTDVGGINLAEGTATVDDMNDAFREIMAQVKNSAVTLTGTQTLSNKSFSGNLGIASAAGGGLVPNTADGADSSSAYLYGGGAGASSRGAAMVVYGNDHVSRPGQVLALPGSGSTIELLGPTNVGGLLGLQVGASTAPTAEGKVQYNSTKKAVVVGDGSTTKTYRPNEWETVLARTVTAETLTTVDNLSAFKTIRLTGRFNPATDAVKFYMITSADNGNTFATTLGDYAYTQLRTLGAAVSGNGTASADAIPIEPNNIGNAAGEGIAFELVLHDFNAAVHSLMNGTSTGVNAAGDPIAATLMGKRNSAQALNAFRLYVTSGTFSGYLFVEGIRG